MDYKLPTRFKESNKSTYGRLLNIAGSDYMPGAAYLSSVAALKSGCGYCFLASVERVIDLVGSQTSNVVFVPLSDIEKYIKSSDVISIGCGLSTNMIAFNTFKTLISCMSNNKPLIIDADGLNLLSDHYDMFINRKFKNVVLTPHPKEASRLLSVSLNYILSNLEESALKISQKYNCVTVLKTHKTVVTSFRDDRIYINNTGNSALAKAGSGDVLTGMISSLVAQGMDLFEAASLGAYLHGLCGDFARENLTEYSVMANDLIEYIPKVFAYYLSST